MKILMTASTFSHIRNFHLPYIQYMSDHGHEVDICCGGSYEELPYVNHSYPVAFEKKITSPQNFKVKDKIHDILKSEHYDLVICHTSLAACFTRLAVRGINPKPTVINVVHGYLFDDHTKVLKKWILSTVEKILSGVTDKVITMNEWDDQYATKHHLGMIVTKIPGMGFDESRIQFITQDQKNEIRASLGVCDGEKMLMYGAELSKRKSQHVLIRAMAQLPSEYHLVLAGEGAEKESYIALAKELHVEDRVHFIGFLSNIMDYYQAADAIVSSSSIEGLPFNVMEAMACGTLVIASDVKGHNDLITDGVSGYLYPYGDHDALAKKVITAFSDHNTQERMIENAQAFVENYTLRNVMDHVLEAYSLKE